jgi:hypothetical protein
MVSKLLTKYPIFMLGILMLTIFLFQLRDKGFLEARKDKMMPTSCRAVRVKLEKRIPSNWETLCEGNNLAVSINFLMEKAKLKDPKMLRPMMYRELANDLIMIAKNSPVDSLERTDIVRVKISHTDLEINAVTEGRFIIKLATIKSADLIKEHLKATVQVKESKK